MIGGGPAGSSAGTTLARRGHQVLVVERECFPRFHIGESQLPWINEVLVELGAHDTVAVQGFIHKWGASFTTANGEADQYADFSQAYEVPRPQTYQVPRATFDQVLLDHAASCGAHVLQGHTVREAVFEPDGVTVSYTASDGSRDFHSRGGRHRRFGTRRLHRQTVWRTPKGSGAQQYLGALSVRRSPAQ